MNDQDLATYEAKENPSRSDLAVLVAEVRRLRLILETKDVRVDDVASPGFVGGSGTVPAPAASVDSLNVGRASDRGARTPLPPPDDAPR